MVSSDSVEVGAVVLGVAWLRRQHTPYQHRLLAPTNPPRTVLTAEMLRRRVNLTTRVALRSNGADPTSGFSDAGKLEQQEQDQ